MFVVFNVNSVLAPSKLHLAVSRIAPGVCGGREEGGVVLQPISATFTF